MSADRGSREATQAVDRDGHLSSASETPQISVKVLKKWDAEVEKSAGREEQNQGEALVDHLHVPR